MPLNPELVRSIDVKSILSKTNTPLGGYAANPYRGCPHACKYCYASFMKRFTGHTEAWGTFCDVKYWPEIKITRRMQGQHVLIGTVTDGYNPLEKDFQRTRALLTQLQGSGMRLTVITKSDLVLRDLELLKTFPEVTVAFSINTLDEKFRQDMDEAASIERRLQALKQVHEAGLRAVCFISPTFPGITDVQAIIERVKDRCDLVWVENLNLRGDYKFVILNYIAQHYPYLKELYQAIYMHGDKSYWRNLEEGLHSYALQHDFPYYNNYTPEGKSKPGKPGIVNYLYHEQVRGTENSGRRSTNGCTDSSDNTDKTAAEVEFRLS